MKRELSPARRIYFWLWIGGIACLAASLILDAGDIKNGLRSVSVLLMMAGLFFLIRARREGG